MGSNRGACRGRRDYCVGNPSRGRRMKRGLLVLALACWASIAQAQAVGGADKARPVTGDPGISSMLVMDRPEFRVLRDYAEPGATRRMHSHDDATYHVLTVVTGQLRLTIEGQSPMDIAQGQVIDLKGGAKHTFTNTGTALANGETRTLAGVTVEAIPAYDLKPGEPSHPKGKANGYLVTLGGKRIYFAGVTECVPEIRALRNIDIAFLPMNLPLDRMAPAAAAECANAIKPKMVYLYHYDQNYAAGKTDAAAIAASIQSFRDAIRGGSIEFKDGAWYPQKK